MNPRFLHIIVAAVVFVITLTFLAWREGLWARSAASPVAATKPAAQWVAVTRTAVKADSLPVQSAVPDTVRADVPNDSPAVTADSITSPPSQPEPRERQREAVRGARTR